MAVRAIDASHGKLKLLKLLLSLEQFRAMGKPTFLCGTSMNSPKKACAWWIAQTSDQDPRLPRHKSRKSFRERPSLRLFRTRLN